MYLLKFLHFLNNFGWLIIFIDTRYDYDQGPQRNIALQNNVCCKIKNGTTENLYLNYTRKKKSKKYVGF